MVWSEYSFVYQMILFLITLNKFDLNSIFVNVNKLKPYWLLDIET